MQNYMFAVISGQIASEVLEEQMNDGTLIKRFIVSVHKEFNNKVTIHEFPAFIFGKYAEMFNGNEGDDVILECEPRSKSFQSKAGKECFDISFKVNKFTVIPCNVQPKFAGASSVKPAAQPPAPAQKSEQTARYQPPQAKTLPTLPADENNDEIPF